MAGPLTGEDTGRGPSAPGLCRARPGRAMFAVFVGFLELPDGVGDQLPFTVREAIGGGIWTIVRHEIQAGRGSELVGLAPTIIDFATIPFGEVGRILRPPRREFARVLPARRTRRPSGG